MNRKLKLILLIILLLQISACGIKTTASELPETNPIAWIDAPLNHQNIPFGPYEIIFHISDSIHMQAGEVSINGEVVDTIDVPKPDNLSVIRYLWTPVRPGETTISVRGKNASGEWSTPAQVLIYVGEPEPSETPVPTETPTPVFTHTPTFTPTASPTLMPTPGPAPITFINPHVNTNQIYWGGSGTCGREEVDFYVTVPPAAEVSWVKVRYRVIDLDGIYPPTEWGEKQMYLNNAYNGEWLVSVKGYNMFPLGTRSASHGRVEYYFVAFRYADNATASSSVKNDLRLDYCSN